MDIRKQLINLLKEYKYVALILAIGLLLMLLPEKQESAPAQPTAQAAQTTEDRLEEILSQIQGVGRVRVMLTIAQGEQTIYVYDQDRSDTLDSDSSRTEAVIITNEDRSQNGLVAQILSPIYRGAVIVCQGGDLPGVQLAIVEAVCDATGLTADKISVLKMK